MCEILNGKAQIDRSYMTSKFVNFKFFKSDKNFEFLKIAPEATKMDFGTQKFA